MSSHLQIDQSWRPDGSNKADYINHGRDPYRWAWEFLRRNPEYQADYARWNSLPDSEIAEDGMSVWSMKFDRPSWGDFEPMTYFEPCEDFPALSDETFGEYEQRLGKTPVPLERALCHKWGLITLSLGDPSKSYRDTPGPQFVTHPRHEIFAPLHLQCRGAKEMFHPWIDRETFSSGTKKMVSANVLYDLGPEDCDEAKYLDTNISSQNYAVFAFDLRIDPLLQTEVACELLRDMREKRVKTNGGIKPLVLLRKLRILDAIEVSGASQAAVADLIDEDAATISKDLKAARALVADGYRKMARIE